MRLNMMIIFVSFICVVRGYINILLIGPTKDTHLIARHYSRFYNIPFYKKPSHIYPMRFIITSEEKTNNSVQDAIVIDVNDYPHKDKNPNYFISWIKQIY